MQNTKSVPLDDWWYGARGGAALGVILTFAYALAFVVYATVRSTLLVFSAGVEIDVPGTLVAYAISLAVAALAIAALMAIPAALIGIVTAILLKKALFVLNSKHSPRRAALIGSSVCLILAALFHFAVQFGLGFALVDVFANLETYLLWLGIPTLLYVAVGGAAAWRLNAHWSEASEPSVAVKSGSRPLPVESHG